METSLDDFTQERAPAAKFASIGDTVKLRLTGYERRDLRSFENDEIVLDKKGRPLDEFIFHGVTDSGEELRIFASKGMWFTIKDAIRDGIAEAGDGASRDIVGATLVVKFDHETPSENPRFKPRKEYKAKFTPAPAKQIDVDDLL